MEALGIETKLLLGQIVNFSILLLILWLFAYKPLVKMLEGRREKIAQSMKDAEDISQKLADTEERVQELIAQAQNDSKRMIEQATKTADVQKNEIIAASKTQAERIMKQAQDDAKATQDKIVSESKKELASLITQALDKIVGKEISVEDKRRLANKSIKDL